MIIVAALVAGRALAGVPAMPHQPGPSAAIPGECAEVVGVDRGDLIPGVLADPDLLAPCAFLAVPLSLYADLLNAETDRDEVRARYEIDAATWAFKEEWYTAELTRITEPSPILQRPGTHAAVGLLAGVGLVMGAAYALGQIDTAADSQQ